MGLLLIEAPADPLVELAAMKAFLHVDHADDDELISSLIEEATSYLDGKDGRLRRALLPQTWDYLIDDFPDGGFRLPLPPLIEVVSLKYIDPDGAVQTMDTADYKVDPYREPGWIMPGENGWPATMATINAVTVRFRAGYEQDGQSGNQPVPPMIVALAKRIVAHWYEHRGDEIEGELPDSTIALIDQARVYD